MIETGRRVGVMKLMVFLKHWTMMMMMRVWECWEEFLTETPAAGSESQYNV